MVRRFAEWRAARRDRPPHSLRRSFVTPEGVDLRLELGGAGVRATAFMLDALFMLILLIVATLIIVYIAQASRTELLVALWLIGFFVLRNGWFALFEMSGRGATPGKRIMGLRVIARDGARLTGGAVLARNAMREIEIFLPLSFLGFQAAEGAADAFLILFALAWSFIFLFFPLTNRDRLRIGDLIGGTWVVRTSRGALGADLAAAPVAERRRFTDAALDLYGVYELQTLEDVLRTGRPDAIEAVAATVRRKAGLAYDGDDRGFLTDYYTALCARLERGVMLGRRRENKFAGPGAGTGARG
jgi:uncharacterized RDD family membrane protein YckC